MFSLSAENIQADILQQSKEQPNLFFGSYGKYAFMLILIDLFEFKVIVELKLRVASFHGVGGFQQVIMEIAVAGLSHENALLQSRRTGSCVR